MEEGERPEALALDRTTTVTFEQTKQISLSRIKNSTSVVTRGSVLLGERI